jgi:hypothetical protein
MRQILLVLLSVSIGLTAAVSVAAPAPGDKEANKELEALWADMYKDEPTASNAVLKLFKQPDKATSFLKEKLRPLRLDADRCKQLLTDLGSPEEKVWKAAWDELDYLDPRLAIDLPTLMKDVPEGPARTRTVELCSERKADSLSGKHVEIRPVGDDGFSFFADIGSWWAEHRIDRIGVPSWNPKMSWVRAARGVALLEQIGSAEAVKALEQLADGHPDAFPTKAAKESLKRLTKNTKENTRDLEVEMRILRRQLERIEMRLSEIEKVKQK